MSILQRCVNTLAAVAAIDDEAIRPLGTAALAAYEMEALDMPEIQVERLQLLSLEFTRQSEPTFTALLIHHDISARMQAASLLAKFGDASAVSLDIGEGLGLRPLRRTTG